MRATKPYPRTATPVWNFVTYLILTLIGLVIYQIWLPTMNLFVGVGVFIIGVYLVTGVSAMVLPYRKKTRDIWTFAREVTSRDPNWKLVATQAPN